MAWQRAIRDEELRDGDRTVVEVEGRKILVVRQRGQLYAIAPRCPHMGGRLVKGDITDRGTIVCPWHRSEFDMEMGSVLSWTPWPPVIGRILGTFYKRKSLPIFPVRVEAGWVEVKLEDGAM